MPIPKKEPQRKMRRGMPLRAKQLENIGRGSIQQVTVSGNSGTSTSFNGNSLNITNENNVSRPRIGGQALWVPYEGE